MAGRINLELFDMETARMAVSAGTRALAPFSRPCASHADLLAEKRREKSRIDCCSFTRFGPLSEKRFPKNQGSPVLIPRVAARGARRAGRGELHAKSDVTAIRQALGC
jgi:hypothetical protein